MPNIEYQYLDIMSRILNSGIKKEDRTGTGTLSLFGLQMRHDLLHHDFPLLTTKKLFTRGIVQELLWFLRGETNIAPLLQEGVHIWDEWADSQGNLGPIYGAQWRSFQGIIDQIEEAVHLLRNEPNSRRILVSSWDPTVLPKTNIEPKLNPQFDRQSLAPCHVMFQLYTQPLTLPQRIAWAEKHKGFVCYYSTNLEDSLAELGVPTRGISLQLYQRSGDWFLGIPFNMASYSLLLMMFAHMTGMVALEFIHTLGDAHIYSNHIHQCQTQLVREVRPLPKMIISSVASAMDQFRYEDFTLTGYDPHPAIRGAISV